MIYSVQAAERLVMNHAAVTRFALRGVGKPGTRFHAPLAEPDAVPDMSSKDIVSTALQFTATALLQGTDAARAALEASTWLGVGLVERQSNAEIITMCLSYLRDRVGVPRDLRLPAARQLRAHLNWTIDAINAAV
jgi:glutathione S-transferase